MHKRIGGMIGGICVAGFTLSLIAQLRNTPGICGLPMPRNNPPLPEEEIQTIEAWINALPH